MIFISKNEDGIPAWKLILEGKKTVTRRLESVDVGKSLAVCPGHGIKAVCRIKVISCEDDDIWQDRQVREQPCGWWRKEAHKEGFKTWDGLWEWIGKYCKRPLPQLFRIEFVKEGA